jgi:transketolase
MSPTAASLRGWNGIVRRARGNPIALPAFVSLSSQGYSMTDTATTATSANTDLREDGSIERLSIDTIRTLSMDAVQKANSGHPGTPMALAPVGYTLWSQFLRYDTRHADWPNRDRFVLSVGHASMLLYSLIHLAGIEEISADGEKSGKEALSLWDLEQFRQLSSKTPGHPEYRHTTGVETTTGPLGAGCGNSVGMAIAERWLAARFNKPGFTLFDHDVYALCGDGDMMEGVSAEAASLAGHLKLSNLCWIYDSNHISIEGATDLAFDEDVGKRFEAYGWNVIHVDDANDTAALAKALETFKATDDRPTFIVVHSVIGWGSPKAGSEKAHGEPLGEENVAKTKEAYGWDPAKSFFIPDGVLDDFRGKLARGQKLRDEWVALVDRYREEHGQLGHELDQMLKDELPDGWDAGVPEFPADEKGLASRDSSGKVLNALVKTVPWLIGGSADLAPSTKTDIKEADSFEASNYSGRNFHFGVREHGMGAVVNGMALSHLRAYGSTFLVFLDYMRPPVRLSAIMEIGSVWIYTHDSIGVGEDGPTHQPIEHLATLRAIPGLDTLRPGDANEVAWAWKGIVQEADHPSALILSRQALPTLDRSKYASAEGTLKGAYVLADCEDTPEVILMATGSELSLVVEAYEQLTADGVKARVVSMPSWYRYEKQDEAYRESVLPSAVKARVAVEMAGEFGWPRYVGHDGRIIAMSTFGASAPIAKLQDKYGFTVDNVVKVAREVMN